MKGDVKKWRENFIRFKKWDTPSQRKVQKLEAKIILNWILELDNQKFNILEVGCGNGYLGKIVSERLCEKGRLSHYTFSDILPECVDMSESKMENSNVPKEKLGFKKIDIYKGLDSLEEGSQDVIISTGFASAATYKDSVPVVSKILKRKGVLIVDFVNDLSPLLIFGKPFKSVKKLFGFIFGKKSYHFGKMGLRSFYKNFGLSLVRSKAIRYMRNPIICMFVKR